MVYALFAIIAISCVKVDIKPVSFDTVATLHLRNTDLVETRANGIERLNENYIGNIQCFFYDTDENILYSTGVISVNQNDEGAGVNKPLSIPSDVLSRIFPTGTDSCTLYVVANAPKVTLDSDPTISDIEKVAITLSKDENNVLKGKQDSFVMDGYATVKIKSDNSIGGTVKLKRAAAKIQVSLQVNNEIIVGEGDEAVIWTPDLENVKIYYNYSATASAVSAEFDDAGALATFSQENDPFVFTEGNTFSSGKQTLPFYSYPRKWVDNNADDAANIKLVIPWQATLESGAEVYETYTYQIPVNYDSKELVRNNIYQLTVKIGILGSLSGEVEITPSYVVVDWQTQQINTDLTKATYLVVDENVVVMNNVDTYSVGYASSDPVTAVITNITKPDMLEIPIEDITIYPTSTQQTGAATVTPGTSIKGNRNPFSVQVVDGKIVLTHELVNNRDLDTFDYYQYTITVKVTNESGMTETIVFTQNPAMYIDPSLNSGYKVNNSKGYVFVNGNNAVNTDWNVVAGSLNTGTSNSPYMYVINVTSFSDNQYVIGDPRSFEVDNPSYNNFASAPAIYDGTQNRRLSYYYPTLTSPEYANYIAPKFRICSGYGRLNNGTVDSRDEAERRCAAYQEDGYPAGRWRLPTRAELEFVGRLCADKLIPTLFSNKSYWAASSAFTYSNTNGTFRETNSADVVRCVYDDWYWGSEPAVPVNTFTWGDAPRN